MITAYSSEQAKTEAYIAGCNEYILKPITRKKSFSLLEKYLKSSISVPHSYWSDSSLPLQEYHTKNIFASIEALRNKLRRTDPPLGGELGEAQCARGD